MPARDDTGAKLSTRLAQVRDWRDATQEALAAHVGMSLSGYRRLERGELPNPPLRDLVNCAAALGVPLADVLEPEWLEWSGQDPKPPDHGFWPTRKVDVGLFERFGLKPPPVREADALLASPVPAGGMTDATGRPTTAGRGSAE